MKKRLGIYIHIPFCASKCSYCDFYSLSGCDYLMPEYHEALLDHLARETRAPRYACALAADISFELGFLGAGEGAPLRFTLPEERREISQSATFALLASLPGMHEHAINTTRCAEAGASTHNNA